MEVIKVRNPQQGLPTTIEKIQQKGVSRKTRYGDVLVFPQPVTVLFERPWERVLFWAERDTNPFFNLMEFLWMVAGRNDVKFVEQFVKRMREFSDDGKKFHAAYGHRWRKHFNRDQLPLIINALKENKECRRQVLGIWDVRKDLDRKGKDTPCNLGATFQINFDGELDMVVHNRSNDLIFGTFAANISHFSMLQEYIAAGVEVPIGRYWQVSSNLHIYKNDLEKYSHLSKYAPDPHRQIPQCPYSSNSVQPTQIVDTNVKEWTEDLYMWFNDPLKVGIRSAFFKRVATPMLIAHRAYKKGKREEAIEIISTQMADGYDWKIASLEWLERRKK